MILLQRKRMIIILVAIFISIFSYLLGSTHMYETVQTVSLPVSGKTVILDAGHGGEDKGAESSKGTTEAGINLSITLKVQKLLEQSGCTVILTRSDDNAIYDLDKQTLRQKKVSDIKNRVKIGNESSADIFVSIHLNKISESQYNGWQTFYKNSNEKSKQLATCLQNSLNESIQKENKRVPLKIDNVYIMKKVEIPTSIVECGFLSNPEEENALLTDEYQDKLAWGIYTGIIDYFYK